jgi:transmembrane sensor
MNKDKRPIPHAVAEAAAEWIVRRDGGPLSAEDEAAFQLWLADPAHREATSRLEGVWGILDEQPATKTELPPQFAPRGRIRWRRSGEAPRPRWRRLAASAVAASLALALIGGAQDWPTRLRADYVTDVGERRTAHLSDGSTVELDSRSAIALHFSNGRREIELLAGTALFTVAPERQRPFVVTANGGSVTALGTAFMVRQSAAGADVTVTLHRVRVETAERAITVGEGQTANYASDTLQGPFPADRAATAWTRGRLVVADRPLAEVIEEIGRYRRGYITVSGPAAALRVSGVYDLDQPLAAIDNIEKSLGLTSFRLTDRVIILQR